MELWVCGLGPAGEGLAEEFGLASPPFQSSGPARAVRPPLGSVSPLSPKDWLWKLLSTLEDKLSVQAPGPRPGMGGDWAGESRDLPVPFPPPPSVLRPEEEDPVDVRAGGTEWDRFWGCSLVGRRRKREEHILGELLNWLAPNSLLPPQHRPPPPPPGAWVPHQDL